jgi:hypothetical protein
LSAGGIDALIKEYEAIIGNKKPLSNGKLYRDSSEKDKNHVNTLRDIARMTKITLVEERVLSEGQKDYLVYTIFESTILNQEVVANLSDSDWDREFVEAGRLLRTMEPVLGKHYVDSKIKQFDRLKKRRRPGKGSGANPSTGRLFLYVSERISL